MGEDIEILPGLQIGIFATGSVAVLRVRVDRKELKRWLLSDG